MDLETFHWTNKNLALETYRCYVSQVLRLLQKRLRNRLKLEKMYATVELFVVENELFIEFTKRKNLVATITLDESKPWRFSAWLSLTDATIPANFESQEYWVDYSQDVVLNPDLQAKKLESEFLEYIKDFYYLEKRISIKPI